MSPFCMQKWQNQSRRKCSEWLMKNCQLCYNVRWFTTENIHIMAYTFGDSLWSRISLQALDLLWSQFSWKVTMIHYNHHKPHLKVHYKPKLILMWYTKQTSNKSNDTPLKFSWRNHQSWYMWTSRREHLNYAIKGTNQNHRSNLPKGIKACNCCKRRSL